MTDAVTLNGQGATQAPGGQGACVKAETVTFSRRSFMHVFSHQTPDRRTARLRMPGPSTGRLRLPRTRTAQHLLPNPNNDTDPDKTRWIL